MDEQRRVEELSRQLRDERRLRDAAERRAAKQTSNARIWRERAEARKERIESLVAEREARGSLVGRLRANARDLRRDPAPAASPQPAAQAGTVAPAASRTRAPGLATVQLAHLVQDVHAARVRDECTGHDLADGSAGYFESDVVMVEQRALEASSSEVREAFDDWVALDARQPLVWIGAPTELPGTTLVVTPGDDVLRWTLDPTDDTPVGRASTPVAAPVTDLDDGTAEAVAADARATQRAGDEDPVRAADLRRRVAWRDHAPAAVAAHLLTRAGLSFESPVPEVAGVLVSNRPDDLRRQLRAFPHQRHPRLRLQVGCHGFSSEVARAELDGVAGQLEVEVVDLPGDRPLGWCLNRMIEGVGSPVLAKIDDDDHYGPGYLIDAVQALDYAQAAIVGRVCSFTHLEGQGETVLRRIGDEERYYDGTLIGATMVFTRSAWERVPFAHKTLAEDVSFQRGVMALGERMYVASRWDFVYRRRQVGNTWRAPDEHFLAHAETAWEGWSPSRADLEPSDALAAIEA